jgi:hypothetical protein
MNKLDLQKVCCVLVDGVDPNQSAKVLNYCADLCDFHSIKLFSFEKPNVQYNHEFIQIKKFTYPEYNRFLIKDLSPYINTDYVLIIQTDGFIVNINCWSNDFLQYDYIGAPWVHGTLPNTRVGNGGFSLRSKKFIERCSASDIAINSNQEDIVVCSTNKHIIEQSGLKYAPVEVAAKFSWGGDIPEIQRSWKDCFGAHCKIQEFLNLIK